MNGLSTSVSYLTSGGNSTAQELRKETTYIQNELSALSLYQANELHMESIEN